MSCGHQVTRLASGYSATSSSDATPSACARPIELQQDRQSDQQQRRQEHQRLARPQHAGGQRPARGARHHAVDVAVPEVVHHAAGGAHHQAADGEQQDQPRPPRAGGGPDSRMPHSPGRNSSQMPIGPIDARQQQVGQPGSRQPRHPAGRDDVGVRLHGCYSARRHDRVNPPLRRPRRWPPAKASPASAAQAHYLGNCHAPRAAAIRCVLFNGRDGEFSARIETIRRDRASLRVEQQLRAQAPEPDLWLAFALLKRDATDLVVQKATELGVAALLPVITERSNTHRMNADRLAAIAIEAAEQCERLTVPQLHPPRPLDALLADWPRDRRLFAAVERSDAPRHRARRDGPARAAGRSGRRLRAGGA